MQNTSHAVMAHVDLCSGIGGFALGFDWAGLSKPVLFCDIEPWSRKVLAKHWPDVPIAIDVKELARDPGRLVPDCDILTAGYPCQPFSVAGKQRGADDDRHIWPYVSQIIAHKRPAWCVLENVYGHVALGIDEVLADLEAQDYATRAFVVPACGVDAPHRRDRIWIIGYTNSPGEPDVPRFPEEGQRMGSTASNDADANSQRSHRAEQHQHGSGESTDRQERELGSVREVLARRGDTAERSTANVAYADSGASRGRTASEQANSQRRNISKARRESVQSRDRSARSSDIEQSREDVAYADSKRGCLRHTEWQDAEDAGQSSRCQKHGGWNTEPAMGRVAHGIPGRVDRLKGLGNAIVPQIAMQIGLTIKAMDDE